MPVNELLTIPGARGIPSLVARLPGVGHYIHNIVVEKSIKGVIYISQLLGLCAICLRVINYQWIYGQLLTTITHDTVYAASFLFSVGIAGGE